MIDNPYKVLGVSENATQDEIKKAYRRKSKECHPDLHPDDKDASRKMNEVNEAYAILSNPDKLEAWKMQQRAGAYGGSSSGTGSSGGYSGAYGQYGPYGQRQYQQRQYQGGGYTTWTTADSFEDIFNMFMGMQSNVDTTPHREASDSAEIGRAVDAINRKDYQQAMRILVNIPSYERNARWYYLSAMANYCSGNTVRGQEHIRKAVELDQNNKVYRSLYRTYNSAGYSYAGGYGGSGYSSSDGSGSNGGAYGSGGFGGSGNQSNGRYYKSSNSGCLSTVIKFGLIMLAIRMISRIFWFMSMGGGGMMGF